MSNPYASFLPTGASPDQVREALGQTAAKLGDHVRRLGEDRVNTPPAPGKWSVREIICHLAECELVFVFRLKQALAQDYHVVQPFDQDLWATNYAIFSTAEALALFSAARAWNLRLIDALTPEQWEKKLTHPERGELIIRSQIETMSGHDINHLHQIERLL